MQPRAVMRMKVWIVTWRNTVLHLYLPLPPPKKKIQRNESDGSRGNIQKSSINMWVYIWLQLGSFQKQLQFCEQKFTTESTKLFMLRSKGITGIPWGTSRRRARGASRTSSNGWGTGAWWSIFQESAKSDPKSPEFFLLSKLSQWPTTLLKTWYGFPWT